MAQASTKVIDISRSYVPMDPNGFPESMHGTGGEDSPEQRVPVIPYVGYNFMPTGYGYMSYFGINSLFEKPLLGLTTPFDPLRADDLFLVQTPALSNIFVALCEDGIYTKVASNDDNWDKIIALTIPDAGEHKNWTRVVIGNEVYMYRAGEAHVWVMRVAENFVPTELTPTHLNMAAQQGIYRAGARLGFWDSASSTAWSDSDVKTDFVPSLETGAGAAIFQQVIGKIVNVLAHGNGFVIYATRSIVYVQRTTDNNFLFAATTIFNDNGISYLQEACIGQPDTVHFAYTTFGLVKIDQGKAEYIIPEVFSFLKESRDPVYPKILEGRYLFLQVLNPDYMTGIPNFSIEEIPGSTITFKGASYIVENPSQNPCQALRAAEQNTSRYLFDTFGFTRYNQANTPDTVPIWEDHLSLNIALAIMQLYKDSGVSGQGSVAYFDDQTFTGGAITRIDGSGDECFLPAAASCPGLLTDYVGSPTLPIMYVEDNERNFFMKQDFTWLYESNFFKDWKDGISKRAHGQYDATTYASTPGTNGTVAIPHVFGPFIDLSFFSEANKYYGTAEFSAWLQRSLTRSITVNVTEKLGTLSSTELGWMYSDQSAGDLAPPILSFANHAIAAVGTGLAAAILAANPDATGIVISPIDDQVASGPIGRRIVYGVSGTFPSAGGARIYSVIYLPAENGVAVDITDTAVLGGEPVYAILQRQVFDSPEFKFSDLPTCVYKNLGYTKVKGFGHYELDGDFVQDSGAVRTEEAALAALLAFTGAANEAALWALVGADDKAEFLAFYSLPSYVALADLVDPGWDGGGGGEDPDYIDQCDLSPIKNRKPKFNGIEIPPALGNGCLPGPVTIDSEVYTYPDQVIQLPPSSFLMQDGSIEPIYPTFAGAYVYDLQLKKWGKDGQPHKLLLNYSPVNNQAGDRPVPQDIFSVNAGCLLEDGNIAIFDKYPIEGFITWGKVGYYRHGFTNCEQIDLQFRNLATGSIIVEGSIDGKNINPAISQIVSYENVNQIRAGFSNSARWFNVTINGIYDIKNIDFNGNRHGKR